MITVNEDIELRFWQYGDEAELQQIADNPNLAKYLKDIFPCPYTMKDAEFWVDFNVKQEKKNNLCILYKGKIVGTIGIIPQNNMFRHNAELGYWLGEAYWNKHIMTVAVKACIPYYLKEFNLTRIFATVASHNIASAKVLENCGFVREAVMKKYAFKYDAFLDGYLYAYVI